MNENENEFEFELELEFSHHHHQYRQFQILFFIEHERFPLCSSASLTKFSLLFLQCTRTSIC